MKSLDNIAEDLFNKIRGRFPSVTIGDANGKVTNDPLTARFFDFDYKEGDRNVGKVSISVTEEALQVMYSNSFVEDQDTLTRQNWYNFLKELRTFAKKRLLKFDTRDINKSNLDKRDYKFLAQQQGGETQMSESKLYGTSRVSYQNIDNARLVIKHTESVNQELASGRTQKIGKIYIESADGERFMYPYKHLNGARAMARHISEGGKPFDDFGKHISGLSEELANLRKFKNYMNRSSVMAESLQEYLGAVVERISTVKKTVEGLQKQSFYKQAFESFEVPVFEDVPDDVASNWIDQLTIKQFNEDLKDVFPYVYKLVSEVTKAKELGPDDLVDEGERHGNDSMYDKCWDGYKKVPGKKRGEKGSCVKAEDIDEAFDDLMGQFAEGSSPHKKGTKAYKKHMAAKHAAMGEDDETDEGNAYAKAVRQAKMNGKKKGDKIQGPDGDEITLEKKIPVTEFVLSLFDRNTGEFPKGETAVLTAVEKDYGEQFIDPAKAFIEKVRETFDNYQMEMHPQQMEAGPVDDLEVGLPAETYKVQKGDTLYSIYKKFKDANFQGSSYEEAERDILDMNPDIKDPAMIQPGMTIKMPYFMGTGPDGASRGLPPGGFTKYEAKDEDKEEPAMSDKLKSYVKKAVKGTKEDSQEFDRMRELAGLR